MNARIDLSLSRREFLKASGALVVCATGPRFIGETLAQTAGGKPPLVPTELDSWVAILPDGRVTAFFGKMDMGQSLDIAIAQIVADELDVDVAKVDVVMGDTALTCNQGGASGSTGIQTGARPLRSAAAEARRLLVQSASQKLGLPVEQLRVDDGVVSAVSDPRKKASYAELIGGRHFHHQVEGNRQIGKPLGTNVQAPPKSPADRRGVREVRPAPELGEIYAHIRKAPVVTREAAVKKGDVEGAFRTAARGVEAEYEWPFQSRASRGPACAVADVRADGVTVWTGSQKPHFVQTGVARLLDLPHEKVRAIWVTGPGSYGRNDAGDAALDAALLSKLTGRPVRVQGMRSDGIAWDPKGPASVHRGRAALDASGKVIGYEFISKGFSRRNIDTNESDPRDSLAGMSIGLPPKPSIDFGVPAESYGFDNKLLAWEVIPPLLDASSPLRSSHLRDPVGPQIQFGSEQFIDELAAAAGEDPVAFRLRYVTAPRDAAVIKAAAEKAGWQPRTAPRAARSGDILSGRGIAHAQRNGTLVPVVAEIEVERKSGRIWGKKFTVAHDCGLIVNPQGLRDTIEGNVVQGLSRTLFEEVRFDREKVTSIDWMSYPILEIRDAPEAIEVVLINHPEIAPTGAGEPSIRVIPAAVANAFFDATGVRLRRAPLTPERVKAALARA